MAYLTCPDCSQRVANMYAHDCPKAKSSDKRTDEALAREVNAAVAGDLRLRRLSSSDDHLSKHQAGVGSERSSLSGSRGGQNAHKASILSDAESGNKPAVKTVAAVASSPRETKRGRPRLEEKRPASSKPWIAEKMSRASWYRRQADARKK